MIYNNRELLGADALKSLLIKLENSKSYYFLRWHDEISGFVNSSVPNFHYPEKQMFEGQMFNSEFELRWKKEGKDSFKLLLLSQVDRSLEEDWEGWKRLEGDWECIVREAYIYREDETRFPQKFIGEKPKIKQCYFRDRKTAIVHFVGLTLAE